MQGAIVKGICNLTCIYDIVTFLGLFSLCHLALCDRRLADLTCIPSPHRYVILTWWLLLEIECDECQKRVNLFK